jgi:hypothetical protein
MISYTELDEEWGQVTRNKCRSDYSYQARPDECV